MSEHSAEKDAGTPYYSDDLVALYRARTTGGDR